MYMTMNSNQPLSADQVFQKILDRIIKLELEPGQKISENQISNEYGVSRSVIRTVFAKLQQLGFIEIYPQRGTYVSRIDLTQIQDLLLLRTAVEKEVIYEMFTTLEPDVRVKLVERLEENIKEQEKCRDEKDYFGKFPKIDSEFHQIMIDSVGRRSLMQLLDGPMLHVSRWRNFDVGFDNRICELIEEHKRIVDAIKKEDMRLAQTQMAIHLETIRGIAERAIVKCPTYFSSN